MNSDMKYHPVREVQTPEEVAADYIASMKSHVDQGLMTMDNLSEIYYEIVSYLREKEGWGEAQL